MQFGVVLHPSFHLQGSVLNHFCGDLQRDDAFLFNGAQSLLRVITHYLDNAAYVDCNVNVVT